MKLIFDIGCNRGVFSQIAKAKYKNVKIIAIDANKDFEHDFIHDDNISFINCAISDKRDIELEFHIDERSTGISTASDWWREHSRFAKGNQYLQKNNGSWNKIIKIRTKTIDDLIEEYGIPNLIKIDLEGYEYEAVKGLSTKTPKLCFEFAEEAKEITMKCLDRLQTIGYTKFGMIGYFHENVDDFATFEEYGDAHMIEPDRYFDYDTFIDYLNQFCNEERAINWGMVWAK